MKGWKILGILVVVGTLIIPIMPAIKALPSGVSPPLAKGHLIFARNRTAPLPDMGYWQHACLYKGGSYILQSDPHCEYWGNHYWHGYSLWRLFWNGYFSSNHDRKVYWYCQLEHGMEHYGIGGVEKAPLDEIFEWYHGKVHYGYVKGVGSSVREAAVDFAQNKADKHKPFDIVSYWANDTKQIDENDEHGLKDKGHGGKYYCAELVWASYMRATNRQIDLDKSHSGRVMPKEIHDYSDRVKIYERYYYWLGRWYEE